MTELEGELVSVAAHQKSIDGRMQFAGSMIFAGGVKPRKPSDASVGRGNISIETGRDVVNDVEHSGEFRHQSLTRRRSATATESERCFHFILHPFLRPASQPAREWGERGRRDIDYIN